MRKWLLSVLVAVVMFGAPHACGAQERIRSFDGEITVKSDGSISVHESILYDFGSASRHGIYRTIPFTKTNMDGKKYEMDFRNISVTQDGDGGGTRYTVSRSAEEISIKIGDPDRTISGEHTYEISYEVRGALTYFSEHDELYWNVTGSGWDVPIDAGRARVTLPSAPAGQDFKLACYTGPVGSTSKDCTFTTDGNTAVFGTTTQQLANNGFTIVTGFPRGMVAVLEPKPYVTFWQTWYGRLLGLILSVGVGVSALLWYVYYPLHVIMKWFRQGRDPGIGAGEARAWYDPPATKTGRKLTPAETGTLVDEVAHQKDISATVVDLARRGYLRIEERKKNDFYFRKLKEYDKDLQGYERDLLSGIFSSKDEVRLKDKKLYETVADVKQTLYTKLTEEGFFPKNPEKIRNFYIVMGVLAMMSFNPGLMLIAFVFGRAMPRKTDYGAQAAQIARGLRNFLTSQERQLAHMALNQINFEKLLPYAVAFGAEKIWAERFRDIELKEPDWYSGYAPGTRFNSVMFTDRLGSSFNSLTTSSTPTRSSSGFSSGGGGGFSGGGGGGGGGGSW